LIFVYALKSNNEVYGAPVGNFRCFCFISNKASNIWLNKRNINEVGILKEKEIQK
jgi:hypothetical protein